MHDSVIDRRVKRASVRQSDLQLYKLDSVRLVHLARCLYAYVPCPSMPSFAVTAHENVKAGGKHLDKAEERGSTFRKFYVGFMLFMTFALLFLHAINP